MEVKFKRTKTIMVSSRPFHFETIEEMFTGKVVSTITIKDEPHFIILLKNNTFTSVPIKDCIKC